MRLLVCGLLLAALSACSSSSPDPGTPPDAESPAATAFDEEAVRAGLAEIFAGDNAGRRDRAAGACFADRLLETTTPEELGGGGLLEEDGGLVETLPSLPEGLARTVADAQLACIDVVESSTRALTAVRKGDLDGKVYADCLSAQLPPDAQRRALVATLTGKWDDPALTTLADAQVACVEEQDG